MSILQEYEKHNKYINFTKMNAMQEYISILKKNGIVLYYSDIVYKKAEWEKFEKWYNNKYGKNTEGN